MFTNQSLVTALFGSILGATTAVMFAFAVAGSVTDRAPSGHTVAITYSVDGPVVSTYPDDSGWD